jgi:hypothetical protein
LAKRPFLSKSDRISLTLPAHDGRLLFFSQNPINTISPNFASL